jgi:hypothetical protein
MLIYLNLCIHINHIYLLPGTITELLGEFLGGRLGGPADVKLASQITRYDS